MTVSRMYTKILMKTLLLGAFTVSTHVALAQDGLPTPNAIVNEVPNTAPTPAVQNLLPPVEAPVPDNANLETPENNTAPDEDVFYDADELVPTGELSRNAPRKVNPALEPASKLIIVRQNASPGSRQAQLVSAARAIKLGRHSSALEIYNNLYKKNKRDPQTLMGRAVALQHLGLIEEAISAYEELLDLRPNNMEAQTNMLGLLSEQFPAIALRKLKDLRSNNPENVGLVAQMAITEARIGNFDSAMRYMGVAASMEPNNANHYFNMGIIADQAGATREAVQYYELALETDTIHGGGRTIPRDQVYTRLAQIR